MIVKMIMIITIMMITTITVKNKVNKVENGTELTFTFKYLSLLMSKLSRTKSSYSEEKEECIKCSENTGCPYSCHEGEKMLVRLGGGGGDCHCRQVLPNIVRPCLLLGLLKLNIFSFGSCEYELLNQQTQNFTNANISSAQLFLLHLLLLSFNISAHFPKEVARGLGLQRQFVNKTVADRGDNVSSRILMEIFQISPLRILTPCAQSKDRLPTRLDRTRTY